MTAPTDPSLAGEAMTAEEGERLVYEYAIGDGKRCAESTQRARAEFAVLAEVERLRAALTSAASEGRREERERCRAICEEILDEHQHDENLARWHCAGDIQERIERGT